MNFLKRRKILKSVSPGGLIPVRVHGHTIVEGKVVILVPKFKSTFTHTLFPKTAQLFYRIKLDEPGSLTWEQIDGKKNINEIISEIESLSKEKNASFQDAENRVGKFMSMLYDWKYISFRQIMNDDN